LTIVDRALICMNMGATFKYREFRIFITCLDPWI